MRYTVYGLFDPRNPQAVRYVGFSADAAARLRRHFSEAKRSPWSTAKLRWIRALLSEGVTPEWRRLGGADTRQGAGARETDLIAQYEAAGHDLTNGTSGGDGIRTWSDWQRQKRSQASSAHWSAQEHRDHQRQAMREYWSSPEGQAKRAELVETGRVAKARQVYSDEAREKMRAAKLGKPQVPRTQEWRDKLSAANKGKHARTWTPEERERRKVSPETRARMSASAQARRKAAAA